MAFARRKPYTLLDHTADLRVRVVGSDLADLFENAGRALFDLLVDGDTALSGETTALAVAGEDLPDLLVNYLRELLYLWTGQEKVVTMIDVEQVATTTVSTRVATVGYRPQHHRIRHEIKAVTYHQVAVNRTDSGWQATVIFDI